MQNKQGPLEVLVYPHPCLRFPCEEVPLDFDPALFFVFKRMQSNIAGRLGNKLGRKSPTAH